MAKFFRASGRPDGPTGDGGRCGACGYPRMGLRPGVACPECGAGPVVAGAAADPGDPLLQHLDDLGRSRVRLGLRLIVVALVVAGLAPAGQWIAAVVFGATGGSSAELRLAMAVVRAGAGLAWLVGVVLALPPVLWDEPGEQDISAWPGSRWRGWMLGCTAAWALAGVGRVAGLLAGVQPDEPAGKVLAAAIVAAGVAGGAAAVVLLRKLARIAVRAELTPADDRLATAAWFAPPIGLGLWMVPDTIIWLVLVLVVLLLAVPWTVILLRAAAGAATMASHLGWAERIGEAAMGREDRIAARRAELDAVARATIRPLPGEPRR